MNPPDLDQILNDLFRLVAVQAGHAARAENPLRKQIHLANAASLRRAAEALENLSLETDAQRARLKRQAHHLTALQKTRESVAMATNCRLWRYYPIEMPVTYEGNGPATVGIDAVKMSYEVWDWLLNTHASFDNLPDAINEAMHLNTNHPLDGSLPEGLYPLTGNTLGLRCASDGCGQHVSVRFESEGIGSDYCMPCGRAIATALRKRGRT